MPDRTVNDDAAERVAEAVRHALRLVGPAERGREYVADDTMTDAPAA